MTLPRLVSGGLLLALAAGTASAQGRNSMQQGPVPPIGGSGQSTPAASAYVAAVWSTNTIHMLDSGMNSTGSFAAGSSLPNGVTSDGNLIWSLHFSTAEVWAYDMTGTPQFSWPISGGLQGLAYVSPAELAVFQGSAIDFHDPLTGAFVRSIPPAESGTVEGIAYDGNSLWQLGTNGLYETDVNTGAILNTLPNAAGVCSFGGTGLADASPSTLILACASGDWYDVNKSDGSVNLSGNNGLDMYGLGAVGGGGPPTPRYVAGVWSTNSIDSLDASLNPISSFPAGAPQPNGVTVGGGLIFSVHFTTNEVIAYDLAGVQQFKWNPLNAGQLALEYISPAEIALFDALSGLVEFYNPLSGAFVRSIPGAEPGTIEGLAWDGTFLWQLGTNGLYATDVNTGAVITTLPNAAGGCSFGGTGLSNSGPSQLAMVCTNGNWYKVSKVDGSVQSSGNNGLDMYGLGFLAGPPQPAAYVAGVWTTNSIDRLDASLNKVGSFPAGAPQPNGVTVGGGLIFSVHFTTNEVIAYDLAGAQQFKWNPLNAGQLALEYISPAEIALYDTLAGQVEFYDPLSGAFVRSIPGAEPGTIEGLAWDGTFLWQLGTNGLYATDVNTGAIITTLPNAAGGCSFGGTGMANSGPSELTLVCTTGNWFKVRKSDGAVMSSGNNGLAMYGLGFLGTGPPCPDLVYCNTNPANAADLTIDTCNTAAGSINLLLSNAPANQFGYPIVGAANGVSTDPPGAQGDLCLIGAAIGRYTKDASFTDGAGGNSWDIWNSVSGGGGGGLPSPPGGTLAPGQTWNFQAWHRDGMNPSKFSKAIQVTFQ